MTTRTLMRGKTPEALRDIPDNSIGSCCTDPPYGLSAEPDIVEVLRHWLSGEFYEHGSKGFMGKGWDSFVPGPDVWREVYRVLKPGGYLVAFSGTRTVDLMTIAIRMAGFEIRDSIDWIYASGFPKSHDAYKGLQRANLCKCEGLAIPYSHDLHESKALPKHSMPVMRQADISEGKPTSPPKNDPMLPLMPQQGIQGGGTKRGKSQVGGLQQSRMERRSDLQEEQGQLSGSQVYPLPGGVVDDGAQGRIHIGASSSDSDSGGEAIGPDGSGPSFRPQYRQQPDNQLGAMAHKSGAQNSRGGVLCQRCGSPIADISKWEGWGTSLKPAHEPIVIARKPLEGTVAGNVLKHGVGGINIEGCRVEAAETDGFAKAWDSPVSTNIPAPGADYKNEQSNRHMVDLSAYKPSGRWPANVVLTHGPGCVLVGSKSVRTGMAVKENLDGRTYNERVYQAKPKDNVTYGDADGMESVEAWDCQEGCPVRDMDNQSQALGGDGGDTGTGTGSASRFFNTYAWSREDLAAEGMTRAIDQAAFMYCPKAGKTERNAGLSSLPLAPSRKLSNNGMQLPRSARAEAAIADAEVEAETETEGIEAEIMAIKAGYEDNQSQGLDARGRTLIREDGSRTLVTKFIPGYNANFHPTVKPIALMRWLIRMVTPPGETTLDPYMGSGTSAVAAVYEDRDFIGVDMDTNPETGEPLGYLAIAEGRTAWAETIMESTGGEPPPLKQEAKARPRRERDASQGLSSARAVTQSQAIQEDMFGYMTEPVTHPTAGSIPYGEPGE